MPELLVVDEVGTFITANSRRSEFYVPFFSPNGTIKPASAPIPISRSRIIVVTRSPMAPPETAGQWDA